jgi:hypothetical protein
MVGPLVQAKVLSPEVTPVAEGLYQMVREIDEQAAAQTTHPVSIETRNQYIRQTKIKPPA